MGDRVRRSSTARSADEFARKPSTGRTPLSARLPMRQSPVKGAAGRETQGWTGSGSAPRTTALQLWRQYSQEHDSRTIEWTAPKTARDFLFGGARGLQQFAEDYASKDHEIAHRRPSDETHRLQSHDPLIIAGHAGGASDHSMKQDGVPFHGYPNGIFLQTDLEKAYLQNRVNELEMQLHNQRPNTAAMERYATTVREEYETRIATLEKKLARFRETKNKLEAVQENLKEKTVLVSSLQVFPPVC